MRSSLKILLLLSLAAWVGLVGALLWNVMAGRAEVLGARAYVLCHEQGVLADHICKACSDRIGGELLRIGLPEDMSEECWGDGPPPINPVTGEPVNP